MSIPDFNPRWKKKCKTFLSKADRQKERGTHLGWEWSRVRRQYLQYFPYCAKCKLLGEEVHHIKPRHTHPELIYDWRNLMTLCSDCHKKEHNMGDGNAQHISR